MFLGYLLKIKVYKCFNQRTKIIFESTNVKVDENFRVQETILGYNFDEEINPRTKRETIKVFYEIDTNFYKQV